MLKVGFHKTHMEAPGGEDGLWGLNPDRLLRLEVGEGAHRNVFRLQESIRLIIRKTA